MTKILEFVFVMAAFYQQGAIQAAEEEAPRFGYLKTSAAKEQAPDNNAGVTCDAKGECQGELVDFKVCHGVAECLFYCKTSAECKWWTWDAPKELCLLFATCQEVPTGERCPKCVSGQRSCNFREDTIPAPCMEQIIESTNKVSLDECADACSSVEECAFYVFDPFEDGDDDCTLFKRCLHMHVGDGIDGGEGSEMED